MAASVKHLSADGITQITVFNWPDAFAGINQTPGKFTFQSTSDRPLANVQIAIGVVGQSDGFQQLRTVLETATVSAPYGFAGVASSTQQGGSWVQIGTRGFRLSATNALGETGPSSEITVNIGDTSQLALLSWTQTPGATGYRLYRTETPGTYGSTALRAIIGSGAIVSFNDTGAALSAGQLPTDNRTAGWLTTLVLSGAGAGGVWPSTGPRYYRVTAKDATGAIIAASLENSVNVDVVTKKVTVSWVAVSGATSYDVFRSESQGSYPSPSLRANVLTTSFEDLGGATSAGSLTLAASYGIPPAVFGSGPIAVGAVAIGQQVFYWVNRVVPGATPEAGNPRVANILIKET